MAGSFWGPVEATVRVRDLSSVAFQVSKFVGAGCLLGFCYEGMRVLTS